MREIDLSTPLSRPLDEDTLSKELRKLFHRNDLQGLIARRSIDARGSAPLYRYKVEVYFPEEQIPHLPLPEYRNVRACESVLVAGSGPAGMFAALELLSLGFRPIVLERGKNVHERKADVDRLVCEGILDPDSNYCFGEGGAGAFSDGKLYTRSTKRGDNMSVLSQFVSFGASPTILYDAHPHIGSDKLPAVVENIRKCVTEHGGEYYFSAKVVDIRALEDSCLEVACEDGRRFHSRAVILATGHSADGVYRMLSSKGSELQAKGFAIGVRAEHPQSLINKVRFHSDGPLLPAAEYSFALQQQGRGVFSFCMCPGGEIVPSSTEEGTIVLNGMSDSRRGGPLANAGVVVQINPEDIGGTSPFRLLDFQHKVERDMYLLAREFTTPSAHPFTAPAQRMTDFCRGRLSRTLPKSSYAPGLVSAPLHEGLPSFVSERLRAAFPRTGIPGYCTDESLLIGVESRTSSPVRVLRNPLSFQAVGFEGLFPCGEGAGYSGGIVSSAIDGIRASRAVARYLFEG